MNLIKLLFVLVILTGEVLIAAPPDVLLGPDTIGNFYERIPYLFHRPYLKGGAGLVDWPVQNVKILESKLETIDDKPLFLTKFSLSVYNNATGTFENFPFTAYLPLKTDSSDNRKSPLTIIYPTIEGETILERHVAKMAIRHGNAAVIAPVFDFAYAKRELGLTDLNQRSLFGVYAVRTLLDYFELSGSDLYSQFGKLSRNIDPYGVKQVGISNGTIAAMLIAAVDPRITQQALVIGIGNVPGVISDSKNDKLTKFRTEQNAFYHIWDTGKFSDLVRRYLKLDPVDFAGEAVKGVKTLLYILEGDTTVPTVYQKELVEAFINHHELEMADLRLVYEEMKKLKYSSKPEVQELYKELEQGLKAGIKFMRDGRKLTKENLTVVKRDMLNHVGQILLTIFIHNKELDAMLARHIPCDSGAKSYYLNDVTKRMWQTSVESGHTKAQVRTEISTPHCGEKLK